MDYTVHSLMYKEIERERAKLQCRMGVQDTCTLQLYRKDEVVPRNILMRSFFLFHGHLNAFGFDHFQIENVNVLVRYVPSAMVFFLLR